MRSLSKLSIFIFLGYSLQFLSGCTIDNEEDNCIRYAGANVEQVNGSHSGTVNQIIPIEISFWCTDGCGQFGNFEQVTNGDTTNINIVAEYRGCVCTQDLPLRNTIYQFTRNTPGIYTLSFRFSTDSSIHHTITIN